MSREYNAADHIATLYGFTTPELIELRGKLAAKDQLDYLRKYVVERAENARLVRLNECLKQENAHLRYEMGDTVDPRLK